MSTSSSKEKTALTCGIILIVAFVLFWVIAKWGGEYIHHPDFAGDIGKIFKFQVKWFFSTLLKLILTVATFWGIVWAVKTWRKK